MATTHKPQTTEQCFGEVWLGALKFPVAGPASQLTDLQNRIRLMFGSNATNIRFEQYADHSDGIYDNNTLVGWITTVELPVQFSQEHQKKAAERQAA